MYDITLITCTGGRNNAFSLCEEYVARQVGKLDIQWIVVDDVGSVTSSLATDVIYPTPKWREGQHTLGRNIREAIEKTNSPKVLFIEDDDWYAPDYVQYYHDKLERYDLFGQGRAVYYNVQHNNYHVHKNMGHASLCQTGIRTEMLFDNVAVFDAESPFYDIELWKVDCKKHIEDSSNLCIGIKGLAGRTGIGIGHRNNTNWITDVNRKMLRTLIGKDAENYE